MTERLTITLREAAAALGVSLNTMSEAVSRGEFPSIRVGRRILIPKAAFEKKLAGDQPEQVAGRDYPLLIPPEERA